MGLGVTSSVCIGTCGLPVVLVSEVRGEVRDDVVVEESARREETSGSDLGSRWEGQRIRFQIKFNERSRYRAPGYIYSDIVDSYTI